jgi:hypothetical protein
MNYKSDPDKPKPKGKDAMEKLKAIFMPVIVLICIIPVFTLIAFAVPIFWILDLFKFLYRTYCKKTS